MANNIAIPDSSATRTLKTTETAGVNVPHYNLDTLAAGGSVDIGGVTETAPSTDTASSGLNGRLQRVAQNITTLTGSKSGGTAAASALLAGGVYNSTAPTLTNGQQASLQFDASGNLKVTGGGGGGGGTQYAEDSAHVSGDIGTMALTVRKDTAAATAGSDGDYQPPITDSTGRLWVNNGAVGAKSPGTAAGASILGGGVYNSAGVTLTDGQQAGFQVDATGALKIAGSFTAGGNGATTTVSVTRPANTTAYAASDAWSDSTSAPTSGGFAFANMSSGSGKIGFLTDAVIVSSATSSLQGEVFLFDTTVTNTNDNAAFALSDTDAVKLVARIPFTLEQGPNNSFSHVPNINATYTTVGSANLYALLRVNAAYTPVSGEVLTLRLKTQYVN